MYDFLFVISSFSDLALVSRGMVMPYQHLIWVTIQ